MPRVINLLLWLTPLLLPDVVQANCNKQGPLFSALQAGCASHVSFCQHHVLDPTKVPPTTGYVYLATYLPHARTHSLTLGLATVTTTATATTITRTLSSTLGHTTTTLDECRPTATCGPVTADRQGPLREACSCILRKTSVITSTFTAADAYFTTYSSTTTFSVLPTTYSVVTKTVPTKTVIHCATAPSPAQTCQNRGHEYAIYHLDEADYDSPPNKWDFETYKKQSPAFNGTDPLLGGIYDHFSGCRKGKRDPGLFSYCDHDYVADRGYIYAPQTGKYHVSIPAYQQAAYIWIGHSAYSGYNQSNALLSATKKGEQLGGGPSATISLKRGTYHPFRIAYRCVQPYKHFDFFMNIRRPDGLVMVGEYSDNGQFTNYAFYDDYNIEYVYSDYVVRFGCGADAEKAPPFPDWGDET